LTVSIYSGSLTVHIHSFPAYEPSISTAILSYLLRFLTSSTCHLRFKHHGLDQALLLGNWVQE
jgi:hypothetical protein